MQVYEYLAKVLNAQLHGGSAGKMPEDISFEQVVSIASRNHLTYMLMSELLKNEEFSDEQMEYLRNCVKGSVFQSLMQATELSHLESEFETNKLKNMPMKGAILKQIYPRPEMREMSDLDILVEASSADKVNEVLLKMGYTLKASIKHHDVYCKGKYVTIEAHKSLYDKSVDVAQYKYFLGFDKAVLREGCSFTYDFLPEDFYVYMIAHAAKHFYAMGCGIRNLIDIYVFLSKYKKSMDMEYVHNELQKCGIADFAYHMEVLAFDWLGGKKLDEFYDSLFRYMLDAGIYGKNENGIWHKFCDVERNNISRSELKRWYYFPPLYYMCEYFPWLDKAPLLLPVAWGIRLIRGFLEHRGKFKREMVKTIKSDQIAEYKQIYEKMKLRFSGK